jgi:hypothetical protein
MVRRTSAVSAACSSSKRSNVGVRVVCGRDAAAAIGCRGGSSLVENAALWRAWMEAVERVFVGG